MTVEKVNDINFREADYYTDSDMALILRDWELHELKRMLEEWVETHSIMQNGTAARIVDAINEYSKETI